MDDTTVKREILSALEWEPEVDPAAIGVTVEDGVVTLFGHVNLPQRHAVEHAVLRVRGVVAVANEIEVDLPAGIRRSDEHLAQLVAAALESNVYVPHQRVKAMVTDGRIVLTGDVDWKYERDAAIAAVRHLTGVRSVANEIRLVLRAQPEDLKARVEEALARSVEIDARTITVDLVGGRIVLRGGTRTWGEREEAERLAWAAPGVAAVENELVVRTPETVSA
jgi:osmotically-inducible protein OsmY